MSNYSVTSSLWKGGFFVPAEIVDRHLKLASADAIRALLYILRNGCTVLSAEEISKALNIDLPAAEDAIDYWINDGLLSSADISVPVARAEDEPCEASGAIQDAEPAVVIKSGKMPSYSNAQIRDAVSAHPELRFMFSSAEEIFARPLSDSIINLLFGLFDWYELPAEVIVSILKRCKGKDRLRPVAIKDEAENFYKHGATTVDTAACFAAELDERDSVIDETVLLLRITDHAPYAKERKTFEQWRYVYGFDGDTVSLAFKVALKNTESDAYSVELLPYIQKVLSNWHKGGIKSFEEAKAALDQKDECKKGKEQKPSGKNKGSNDSSYNLSEEAELAMKRFSGGSAK